MALSVPGPVGRYPNFDHNLGFWWPLLLCVNNVCSSLTQDIVYLMMGFIISSAVLPAKLTLMWKDMNWIAAAASPPLGLMVALIAWLVTAKKTCGSLDVACTGSNHPILAGIFTPRFSHHSNTN
jgi:Na+/proline symporter